MVNYNLGKVYRLEPIVGGKEGDIYIGSTAMPYLCTRMAQHRSDYKQWKNGTRPGTRTSYVLFDKYGFDNVHIVLLENINATSKEELFAGERKWIQSQKCVNKFIPGRKQTEYYEDNKEHILAIHRQYSENNVDKIKAIKKQYDETHKEIIRIRKQQYYQDNKERIAEIHKQYRESRRHDV